MAPLAQVFVRVSPNMLSFGSEAAAGIAAARLGQAGMTQGASFGRSFGSSASKLMVVGFGAGLGLLLERSVKAAGDFQAAMVRLTTSAGETGTRVSGNLKIVSDGILAMAGPVGTTVEALGKAMYTVESGSFHGADALKVLRAAAEGAKAENADLTKVTDATTTALVDYHLGADQSALVVSKLVAATAAGKTTFEGLTGALHSVLPVASAAGISMDDILGSLSSMTLHGISAEQATQNLADTIRHMQAPTAVQAKELALLGLTTQQLNEDLKTKGLSGTLGEISDRIKKLMPPGTDRVILQLKTALNGLSPQVRALGDRLVAGTISFADYRKAARDLTPIQAQQAMSFAGLAGQTHRLGDQQLTGAEAMQSYAGALQRATGDATGMNVALMLTGDNAANTSKSIGMVAGATTEAGDHVAGWGVIQETFNFKMAALHSTLGAVQISLGQALLPVLTSVVGKITEILPPIASWISGHARLTAEIAGTFAGLIALATTVIVIIKIVEAIKTMVAILKLVAIAQWIWNAAVSAFSILTSAANIQIALYLAWSKAVAVATKVWAAAQWLLDAAFSPMGLVVIVIIAVVAAIVYAYFHFDRFRKIVDTVGRALVVAGKAVWAALVVAFHAVADAAVWLWQHGIKPAFEGIVQLAKWWWEAVKFYFTLLRTILMDYVVPAVMWLWKYAIKPAFEGIVFVVKAWWAGIKMYFEFVKGAIDVVGGVVMWLYTTIIHPYFTAMKFMINAWWVAIQIIFAAVKWYIENVIAPPVLWLWRTVIGPSFKAMGDSISFWWTVAKVIFSMVIGFITNTLAPIFTWLWKTIFVDSWNGMVSVITGAWKNGIKPVFSAIADFVTKTIPDAFGKGVDYVGKAWDKLKSVVSAPISWIIDTVINRGLIDTINSIGSALGVKDKIGHVGNPFSGGGGGGGGGRAPMAMADGGLLYGPGGPREDKIPIMASAGEYIIPAHIVQGMGVGFFDNLIGRRKPKLAGDGSNGISVGRYADGGLIEMFTDPAKWIGGKVNGLIDHVPGAGAFRDLGISGARKLVTWAINWVKTKLGFAGGDVGTVQAWLRAQQGKPYLWASAGPGGYDCCVRPTTLVYGPDQPKEIQYLQPGDRVYAYQDGKLVTSRVNAAWMSKVQPTFRVQTRNRDVYASANHPFLRLTEVREVATLPGERGDQGAPWSTEWVRLDQLKRGDYIVTFQGTDDLNQTGDAFPEDLAWFLGLYVGDGCFNNDAIRLCVYGDVRDRASAVVMKHWGRKALHHPTAGMIVNKAAAVRWMREHGFGGRSYEKRIPPIVWTWDVAAQEAFLAGYGAADGWVPKSGSKMRADMVYKSTSEGLMRDLRGLHTKLGHGVTNIRKSERTKPIFIAGVEVKNARPIYGFSVTRARRAATLRTSGKLPNGAQHELSMWDPALGVQPILDITPAGFEETWDINVEGVHNFVADGVVVHNSGIVSSVWNMLHGKSPYSHTFSTSNEAPYFPHSGMGVFTAGWANPGETGGGRVGHTAGWLAGLPFESTGSRGVNVGSGVTPVSSFAHLGHMAAGGLVRRYDSGGSWPSGTLGANTSGRTEHVTSGDAMDEQLALLRRLIAAVERVAPAVGAELTGAARGMRQTARAGA